MQHEFSRTLSAARFFRKIGLVPLPSRMDRKMPLLDPYKQYRTEPVPKIVYADDEWKTTNLQLMTGARTSGSTKIIVIDLDGPMAQDAWKRICKAHDHTPMGNWIVRTGSGGLHIYYRLPVDLERCATRLIWGLYDPLSGPDCKGGWLKHHEVKILADGVLAVSPPSRHVSTGQEYQWLGKWNPAVFPLPAEAPQWLIDMPGLTLPVMVKKASALCEGAHGVISRSKMADGKKDRDAVIGSLSPDEKLRLVQSWGLRFSGSPDARRNWVDCHAVGRKDDRPSAGFDPSTGVYHDFGAAIKLSFFDLAVALGAHKDWKEAMHAVIGLAVR